MKGSIRAFVGFMIAFGAVGGMDNVPGHLVEQVIVGVVGLLIMYSGVNAINKSYC